jgi:phosphatidylserine/phosphatidylglycerophosphate/cardiolipin synthase-like enzyme
VGDKIAAALRRQPGLYLVAVLPHYPDQDGKLSMAPNLVGRDYALSVIRAAAPDRVAVYGVENHAGTPVYVHAKVCVIDDEWASVGSDNFNRRSWTHDSELSVAVWDTALTRDGVRRYPRELRLELAREHLDRKLKATGPAETFEAFAQSAAALQAWHDGGRVGRRPPGRLRPLQTAPTSRLTRLWASPLYRTVYDPDARPLTWRWRGQY